MSLKTKIGVIGSVLAGMLLVACGGQKKSEKVQQFITDFASIVKTDNADSITAYYPSATPADSLVQFNVESITVNPANEQETEFEVKCGDNITMTVSMTQEGKMRIESSKGLFAYAPQRMEMARKFGQWKEGATDAENSKRMNDAFFMQSVVPGIAKEIKENLQARPTGGVTFNGPLGVKVTNNNPFRIDGGDYNVAYVQTSYMRMMMQIAAGSERGTKPGATLAPNASKSYSVPNPMAMAGNEVSSASIKWKLSDEEIVNKYYKPTGKEYEEYLKSVKPADKEAKLGDGPYTITGKIGGKYAIHMTLDKGMKYGSYYYNKKGPGAKLNLRVVNFNKATGQISLEETDASGNVTGTFVGVITPSSFKCQMSVPSTGKTYDCDLAVSQ